MTRTPQKPPTHPIKLKVPSYPILYPAAFRQRRFAAPSLRGEFGGPLDNKATTAGFDPVWGQDTRLAAGEETAPADNSPAAPNFIRQRLPSTTAFHNDKFAAPALAKEKTDHKKRRASRAGSHQRLVAGILQRSPRLRIRHSQYGEASHVVRIPVSHPPRSSGYFRGGRKVKLYP